MRQILPFVNINGKITHRESGLIPILNEEFLYGYGIFTTIKVREGYPLFLDRHLHRLKTSATQLNITPTLNFSKAACTTIAKNKLINGGIRITITPTAIYIHAFTPKYPSPIYPSPGRRRFEEANPLGGRGRSEVFNTDKTGRSTQIQKISVITTPDTRDIYKTHKVTCRIPHLLAQKQAQSQGTRDALFIQNKEIIESTCANIFTYTSNNIIVTPPIKDKGLNGITRQILIENLPVQEAPIPITTTNPLILVNSLSLRIIESIDKRKLNQNPKFVNLIRQTIDEAEKNYIASNSF